MAYETTGLKVRKMRFEHGSHFPGLTVEARGLTVHEFLELGMDDVEGLFWERLVGWDWVHDGTPVPPTREGAAVLDAGDVRTLIREWLAYSIQARRAVGQDPGPLVAATDEEFEARIPMVVSSNGAES